MALGKIFGRRTHACVFVDVDAAKSHPGADRGRLESGFQDSGYIVHVTMISLMISHTCISSVLTFPYE